MKVNQTRISAVLSTAAAFAAMGLVLYACGPAGGAATSQPGNGVSTTSIPIQDSVTLPEARSASLGVPTDPEKSAQFWATKAIPGAIEVEHFESLGEMAASSDLVVIGTLSGLEDGPIVKLDEGEDAVSEYTLRSYRLEISEVLRGTWDSNEVEIHFAVMPQSFDAEGIGEAILFLRSGDTEAKQGAKLGPNADWFTSRYRLVSSQGLFIADSSGLANPLSEAQNEGLDPVLNAWEGRAPAELIDAIG